MPFKLMKKLRRPLASQILNRCGKPGVPVRCVRLRDGQLIMGVYVAMHADESKARDADDPADPPSVRVVCDSFVTSRVDYDVSVTGEGVLMTRDSFSLLPRQVDTADSEVQLLGEIATVEARQLGQPPSLLSVALATASSSSVQMGLHTHELPVPDRDSLCGCCAR